MRSVFDEYLYRHNQQSKAIMEMKDSIKVLMVIGKYRITITVNPAPILTESSFVNREFSFAAQ
ncbi:hypothetical protein OS42_44310 [Dickeya oryzae]